MRTNVYIDGFNLYYGSLKDTPYRWLNIEQLCSKLQRKAQFNRFRYFTALVSAKPNDLLQPQRQQTYLRALQTIPNLSIHYGHFTSHARRMPLAHPPKKGPKTVEVIRTDEKGSDVNLATYLLIDAINNEYDMAMVLSADSDLALAVDFAINRFNKRVGIFHTAERRSAALRQAATFFHPIRNGALGASQFPPTLTDKNGTITKPPSW